VFFPAAEYLVTTRDHRVEGEAFKTEGAVASSEWGENNPLPACAFFKPFLIGTRLGDSARFGFPLP